MQRANRPKSAKGKVRPTPPSQPRPQRNGPSSYNRSLTNSSFRPHEGSPKRDLGSHGDELASSSSRVNNAPEAFPSVERPTSSLSKYRILPSIPPTPNGRRDYSDFLSSSPAESELELDLMSSFAQQMILESAQINGGYNEASTKSIAIEHSALAEHSDAKSRPSKGKNMTTSRTSTIARRHIGSSQDSPVVKKPRNSPKTRSVFSTGRSKGEMYTGKRTVKENDEKVPKIKLALKLPNGKRVERDFKVSDTIATVMNFAQTKMRILMQRCDLYSMLQVPKVKISNWRRTLLELDIKDRTVLYIEEKD